LGNLDKAMTDAGLGDSQTDASDVVVDSTDVLGSATDLQTHLELVNKSAVDGPLYIGAAATGLLATATTLRAQLNELCTSGSDGASKIGATTKGVITGATQGAQMTTVSTHITGTRCIPIPLLSFWEATAGTTIPAYGVGTTGIDITSNNMSIKLDDAGNQVVRTKIPLPNDLDIATNFTIHVDASADAAASGTIDVQVYHTAPGDYANSEGTVLEAAQNVVQAGSELVFTVDVDGAGPALALPSSMDIVITGSPGGTENVLLHDVWIEYNGRLLTS